MRLPLLVVGVGLAAGSGVRGAPRPGRVVRIERNTHRLEGTPRLCQPLVVASSFHGVCFGAKPQPGDQIEIVDQTKLLATVNIKSVVGSGRRCPKNFAWQVTGTVHGNASSPHGMSWGLIDVPLVPGAGHLVASTKSPTGHAPGTDKVAAVVDSDGDGRADAEFVAFACDQEGNPVSSSKVMCLEVWERENQRMVRVRRDRVPICF